MLSLPIEIKALLTYLITQGLKALLALFGKDLAGGMAAVVVVIVGSIVFFIDGILALTPPEYIDSVTAFLALFVSLLSAFGIHKTYKGIGVG